MDKVKMS